MTEAQLIHEGWHMWPYEPHNGCWLWPNGAVGMPLSRHHDWAARGFPKVGIKPAIQVIRYGRYVSSTHTRAA